jgi:Flp pilus assembly protein protease CpaA
MDMRPAIVYFIIVAVFIGAVVIISLTGRRRVNSVIEIGEANTKAVEENTAAIRELIRKLDERKP